MSRIGAKPIQLDNTIRVTTEDSHVTIEGPKGKLTLTKPHGVTIRIDSGQLTVDVEDKEGDAHLHGLYRSLVQNAVIGVTKQWSKMLELVGVGFKAQTSGNELVLNLGFSHPVKVAAPPGISFTVSENKITVVGADKYLVGEVAASIRRIKPPEPYKGKGIRYTGEYIRKKLGKAAKAVGGAAPTK